MDILLYVIAVLILLLALCATIVAVQSRIIGRSVMATLAEVYMKVKRAFFTPRRARAELEGMKKRGETPYILPVRQDNVKCDTRQYDSCGLQIYEFNPQGAAEVLYFYGGGYVHRPLKYHIKFLDKLARRCNCRIIMPVLPRAPYNTYKYCYERVEEFYLSLGRQSNLTLMGDSSGGGLALGLCLKLKTEGKPLPKKLVLMAPWVDLTMTNPEIPAYEKVDPRNSRWLAKLWGETWSGGDDLKNYQLSPIYGALNGLPPIVQYVGTRDILYPDCVLLHQKLQAAGVDSTFIEGRGLNHVYPVYPIPEARVALFQIADDICGEDKPARASEGETPVAQETV